MRRENNTADTGLTLDRSVDKLHKAVRDHYDKLVDLYEQLWGEHIHHGCWDLDAPDVPRDLAQHRTVAELIAFGGLPANARVLDSGCGIGASSIVLARELGCQVDGITLSEEQVRRATEKAGEAGVAGQTTFRVMDALHTDYPDGTFDAAWSLESCELMPDKLAYLKESVRPLGIRHLADLGQHRGHRVDAVPLRLHGADQPLTQIELGIGVLD